MRRIIFSLLVLFILGGYSFAQDTYYKSLTETDQIMTVFLYKNYGFSGLTVRNTGTAICTLTVKGGTLKKSSPTGLWNRYNYQYLDTLWYDIPIKDSDWNSISGGTIILPPSTTKSFVVLRETLDCIKIEASASFEFTVEVYVEPTALSRWR